MSTLHDLYVTDEDRDELLARLGDVDDRSGWQTTWAITRWVAVFIVLPWIVLITVLAAFVVFAVTVGVL